MIPITTISSLIVSEHVMLPIGNRVIRRKSLTAEEYAFDTSLFESAACSLSTEKLGVYSWELVVAIPFRLMGLDPDNLPEKIMGNFYKCADDTEFPHFVSWSPIDLPSPNFHCPEFFGEIYL